MIQKTSAARLEKSVCQLYTPQTALYAQTRQTLHIERPTISTSNASCFFHLCQQHQHIPLIYSSELEGISAHLYINLINISLPSHFLDANRHTKDTMRRHQTSSEMCQAMPGSGSVMIYRALQLILIARQEY